MIIITGASRGIGRFLLEEFISEGNTDVIGFYNKTKPAGFSDHYYQLDVRNYIDIENFFNSVESDLKKLSLINCAGVNYNSFLHKSDPDQWKNVFDSNLFGSYNMIRCLLPVMREQNFGRIINFSSVVAQKPTPGVSAYAASKAALWGLSKSVAAENAAKNITINNINLGYSNLGMIKEVPEKFKTQIISNIPSGTLCESQDIFMTVKLLLENSYINGSSVDLNGGLV
ncbi:MAG: SDR family NAD(P)-dependent oxidoreductase [Candidatus Cyclobacteriaceae bacterium M2_1C_046]